MPSTTELHAKTATPIERLSPQCQDLLRWLQKKGHSTGLQIIKMVGILNYKGRICDLRNAGYDIETRWVERITRHQRKALVADYYLHTPIITQAPS